MVWGVSERSRKRGDQRHIGVAVGGSGAGDRPNSTQKDKSDFSIPALTARRANEK